MRPHHRFALLTILLTFLYPQHVISFGGTANFSALCQDVRQEMIFRNATLEDEPNFECRRTYTPEKGPALAIEITVSECLRRCPGYEATNQSVLNQWVGPLVGFLLPALAFVVTIPRPIRIPRKEEWFGLTKLKSIPWLLFALIPTLFDIIFWIIAVFAFAGPLIAGSIHEALIDHAVLKHASQVQKTHPESALDAIAFSLVGSLRPSEGDLTGRVSAHILESPHAKRKLLALLALLPSYGSRVGIPIVFYLGAYAYALFDAKSKLGDNDTAHAVAFGLWYGVVVIVAIVASSVLGVDNPASLEAVFTENISIGNLASAQNPIPNGPATNTNPSRRGNAYFYQFYFYDSPFRMVWLWERARVFQEWTRRNAPHSPITLTRKVHATAPRVKSGLIASCLISLPCAGACWISYHTPTVGFGCRSVAHLIYAASQIILILGWWMYYSSPYRVRQKQHYQRFTFSSVAMYGLSSIALVAALISSIGGTIMQLAGVFKNCICKGSLAYLLPSNRAKGLILLSNDMQEHRDHAKWWIIIGGIGAGFIGLLSVLGWLAQQRVKSRCKRLLDNLNEKTLDERFYGQAAPGRPPSLTSKLTASPERESGENGPLLRQPGGLD